ncbi:MAG: Stp1/IreP family PP2C-type Ser/Thr phosphatase [Epulopiscium sp.]|nr:Stp1/IreP family PP2C-type Ser/Thr phosphatase [Candidatus Epulonipiscium sp.]
MISAGRCHIGKHRENNEDAIFIHNTRFGCLPNIYIVADGMGGHQAGEKASSLAIQSFCNYIHENREEDISHDNIQSFLIDAIGSANDAVHKKSMENEFLKGMGTTFLVSVIIDEYVYVAHVGDSRLYIIEGNDIHQLTMDHSFVEEMVRKGTLSQSEAKNHPRRNVITRAVGTNFHVDVDTYAYKIDKTSFILMCSDGLSNMVKNQDIIHIIKNNSDIEKIAQALVDKANQNGGFDNISVILIKGMEGR